MEPFCSVLMNESALQEQILNLEVARISQICDQEVLGYIPGRYRQIVGTVVLGKLARSREAAESSFVCTTPENLSRGWLEGAIGEALRESFAPVVDEPMPEKLQDLLSQLRAAEQQKRGR
jgi:hypothetical protein